MGVPRSSDYPTPAAPAEDPVLGEGRAIAEAFPAYGYRRIGAKLRHPGQVVTSKKIRGLMKEHALKVGDVYVADYATFEEVSANLPRFIEEAYNARH